MATEAKVIADSIAENGMRICTLQLKYPRFVHSEFMTHRVFSRNASSSRAIPVEKMIEQVRTNPAMPIHWGQNQPGMQARAELTGDALAHAKECWLIAAGLAADIAEQMEKIGLHKQVANRILEPFQYIHVVVTATEWDNFFALRDHPDADPNIGALARAMGVAMSESKPELLTQGQWHLPYVTREEMDEFPPEMLCRVSAARCARVSYLKHDGNSPELAEDLVLFTRLAGGHPIHASPLEHQALPLLNNQSWSGNFRGWMQFRQRFENLGAYLKNSPPVAIKMEHQKARGYAI